MSEHSNHPAKNNPKNIVVFCDGTWSSSDQKSKCNPPRYIPTNVSKLFRAVSADDANENTQIVHYIRGVATSWDDRFLGGGFGHGISENIKKAINSYAAIMKKATLSSCSVLVAGSIRPLALQALSIMSAF